MQSDSSDKSHSHNSGSDSSRSDNLENFFENHVAKLKYFTDTAPDFSINTYHECFGVPLHQHPEVQKLMLNKAKNFAIFVFCEDGCGYGDILFALKTFDFLQDYFENLYLVVESKSSPAIDKITSISPVHQTRIVNLEELIQKSTKDLEFYSMPKLILVVALPNVNAESSANLFSELPAWSLVFIDEYNGNRVNRLILKKGEVINKSLDSRPVVDENKFQFRKNLISGIGMNEFLNYSFTDSKQFIPSMGIHMGIKHITPCATNKINKVSAASVKGKEVKKLKYYLEDIKFDIHAESKESNGYYFAYNSHGSSEELNHFIECVVQFEAVKRKNDRESEGALGPSDINILIIGGYDPLLIKSSVLQERKVRLRYIEKLSHDDMVTAMSLSKPLIFVSGDQSFAEACSLYKIKKSKIIFYQMQSWKRRLIDQFCTFSYTVTSCEALKSFQNLVYNQFRNSQSTINTEAVKSVLDLLTTKYDEIFQANTLVYEKLNQIFNIEYSLLTIIQHWMLHWHPEYQKIVSEISENVAIALKGMKAINAEKVVTATKSVDSDGSIESKESKNSNSFNRNDTNNDNDDRSCSSVNIDSAEINRLKCKKSKKLRLQNSNNLDGQDNGNNANNANKSKKRKLGCIGKMVKYVKCAKRNKSNDSNRSNERGVVNTI